MILIAKLHFGFPTVSRQIQVAANGMLSGADVLLKCLTDADGDLS